MSLPTAPYTWPDPEVNWGPWRTRYLKRLARKLLDWPDPLPPWALTAYRSLRGPLAEVMRQHTGRFLSALALPCIGPCIAAGDLLAGMPHLLLELARAGLIDENGLFWGAPVSRLVSPHMGVDRHFSPPLTGTLYHSGRVALRPNEEWVLAPGVDRVAWPLRHGGWLLGFDTNPLAMVEAHPEKHGNTVSFGDVSSDTWCAALDTARARMVEFVPELAAEHASIFVGVVPTGAHPEVSFSASYQEAIGLLYLSLHPSSVTMTEALIHEVQHSKLNLLANVAPLLENGDDLYSSPVRPDPRPLWGVLLAVHAFLPVARLHRAMIEGNSPEGDPVRYHDVLRVNHEGMEVLRRHARPVGEGVRLLAGMDALEAALWAAGPG